jgi:hypothetical protein
MTDDPPDIQEIENAVRRLRSGKPPGPSGMTADHLKAWVKLAYDKENPDARARDALVELVQHVFRTGEVPTKLCWGVVSGA